jgi:hypothetical protein
VTFRSPRKKAASPAGSASGPARSFRSRGWAARQELDDGCGSCALGARDADDMGARRSPCVRMKGDSIVAPRGFLTQAHSPSYRPSRQTLQKLPIPVPVVFWAESGALILALV